MITAHLVVVCQFNSPFFFLTVIEEGTVAMYDYKDENENEKHYGQPAPLVYNMVSVPNDFLLFIYTMVGKMFFPMLRM